MGLNAPAHNLRVPQWPIRPLPHGLDNDTELQRIPDRVASRWLFHWPGDGGKQVLVDAVDRLSEALARWSLEAVTPLACSYWGAAFTARSHGRQVVVKINPRTPSGESLHSGEPQALKHWARCGQIAPQVLGSLHDDATFVMERCDPGTTLIRAGLGVAEMIEILGQLCRQIHAVSGAGEFEHLSGSEEAKKWLLALGGTREETELRKLLVPAAGDVLLHFDLHGDNVLRSGSGWQVVDPIPHIGDRNADIYALMYNPQMLEGLPAGKGAAVRYIHRHVSNYVKHADLDFDRAARWLYLRSLYRLWRQKYEQDAIDRVWTQKLSRMVELLPLAIR